MPRRLTLTLLAGVLLGAPAVAQAATPPQGLLQPDSARQAGERALHEASQTLSGRLRKHPYHLSALLRELAVHLSALPVREQTAARRLLARPTSADAQPGENAYSVPEHSPPYCSLHFCVHWVDSTRDAPPLTDLNGNGVPDYVEQVDQVLEHVYQVENVQMGWRAPVSDGTLGGGGVGKVDAYLADLGGEGIFGYSAPDPGQHGNSQAGYLVLDNDYAQAQYHRYSNPLPPLEVTAAHEYNHVLQFGYDVLEDTWMLESTAVWMEDKVYTDVNDYVTYLGPWANLTQVPLTRFNSSDSSDPMNIKVYGDAVWNRWLDAHYGQDTIRQAWEGSAAATPASFAPAAYNAVLARHGTSFYHAFARFAADTAEWGSPQSGFTEGSTWPDVGRLAGSSLSPSSGSVSGHLDHTAYVLVDVVPTGDRRIKLVASLPQGVPGAFALVGRRGAAGSSSLVVRLTERRNGGRATVTLDNPGSYSRITAVLINADVSQDGYVPSAADWHFTNDHETVSGFVSNDFTRPAVRRRSPRPGRRGVSRRASIVVAFSEEVADISPRTVRLVGPDGRRVAARVKYDRRRHVLRLVPRHPLARHSHYVVELGGQIVDAADNSLAARDRAWAFRT